MENDEVCEVSGPSTMDDNVLNNEPLNDNTSAPSSSYSKVAGSGIPPPRLKNIVKMKIFPPFRKKHFEDKTAFDLASKECIKAILLAFPTNLRPNLTIATSFTMKATRKMHSVDVVASADASYYFSKIQTSGIEMLGCTVFPSGEDYWQALPGLYPKQVEIKLLHVPVVCNDAELLELLQLPPNTETIRVKHFTDDVDGIHFYNGKATISVKAQSAEHEDQLRQWSIKSHEEKGYIWEGIPIYAFIPALHSCPHCKKIKKPFHGHDISWCRYAKEAAKTEEAVKVAALNDAAEKKAADKQRNHSMKKKVTEEKHFTESDDISDSDQELGVCTGKNRKQNESDLPWQEVKSKRSRQQEARKERERERVAPKRKKYIFKSDNFLKNPEKNSKSSSLKS